MFFIMFNFDKELERWWVKEVIEPISPLSISFWGKKNAPLSFTRMEMFLLPFGRISIFSKLAGLQHRGNWLINMHRGDSGEDHGDGWSPPFGPKAFSREAKGIAIAISFLYNKRWGVHKANFESLETLGFSMIHAS
jgi:hypothetical protein